ncbi:MAG: hypothetical protein ACLSUW_07730 [Akkermansia sp.]
MPSVAGSLPDGYFLFGLMFAWCPWALSVCNAAAAWLAGSMLGVTQFAAALPCSYLPARLPAQENGAVVVPMQKNAWSVVISNPALVVDTGTENTVRYTLLPILKYLHIQPSGVMTTRNGKPERAGVEVLLQEYPGIQNWGRGAQHSAKEWVLRPGNRVSTADLPEPLPTGVHQDRSPVLAWTCRGRRVLLVGNAGFSTLARAEETERADVLIIGHHPRGPVNAAWIGKPGPDSHFHDGMGMPRAGRRAVPAAGNGALYLKAEEDGVTVA